MVLYNYAFIGALLVVAVAFALAPLLVVFLVAPRRNSRANGDTYECGVRTYGETWVRFRIQYYIYALMFVAFDIEVVFIFLWALIFASATPAAIGGLFLTMLVFVAILLFGLGYAWRKGVLSWR